MRRGERKDREEGKRERRRTRGVRNYEMAGSPGILKRTGNDGEMKGKAVLHETSKPEEVSQVNRAWKMTHMKMYHTLGEML